LTNSIIEQETRPKILTRAERDRLDVYERLIETHFRGFYEAANALAAIRDDRLFMEAYGSIDEYVRDRWNFGKKKPAPNQWRYPPT